jgi:hypothetical protein
MPKGKVRDFETLQKGKGRSSTRTRAQNRCDKCKVISEKGNRDAEEYRLRRQKEVEESLEKGSSFQSALPVCPLIYTSRPHSVNH